MRNKRNLWHYFWNKISRNLLVIVESMSLDNNDHVDNYAHVVQSNAPYLHGTVERILLTLYVNSNAPYLHRTVERILLTLYVNSNAPYSHYT